MPDDQAKQDSDTGAKSDAKPDGTDDAKSTGEAAAAEVKKAGAAQKKEKGADKQDAPGKKAATDALKPRKPRQMGGATEPEPSAQRLSRRKLTWLGLTAFLTVNLAMTMRFFFPRTLFEPKTTFRIGYLWQKPPPRKINETHACRLTKLHGAVVFTRRGAAELLAWRIPQPWPRL